MTDPAPPSAPANAPEHAETCAPGGPTAEHERLHPFVGTFRAEVRLWMDPAAPDPYVSTGTMVNEMDLGGRFLRHTYVGDETDGPFPAFEGRGFWGWNAAAERWEGFWIDNAGTGMDLEHGRLEDDGRTWTMRSTFVDPETRRETAKRSEIVLEDEDRHVMRTWFVGEDGAEAKVMEIRYERAR